MVAKSAPGFAATCSVHVEEPRHPEHHEPAAAPHHVGDADPSFRVPRHEVGRRRTARPCATRTPGAARPWRTPRTTSEQRGLDAIPARPQSTLNTSTPQATRASDSRVDGVAVEERRVVPGGERHDPEHRQRGVEGERAGRKCGRLSAAGPQTWGLRTEGGVHGLSKYQRIEGRVYDISWRRRSGSSPSHSGCSAVASKSDDVLNGSNAPPAAAATRSWPAGRRPRQRSSG